MRPGMTCLLEVLRGESITHTIDEAEWETALALAEEEHVLAVGGSASALAAGSNHGGALKSC